VSRRGIALDSELSGTQTEDLPFSFGTEEEESGTPFDSGPRTDDVASAFASEEEQSAFPSVPPPMDPSRPRQLALIVVELSDFREDTDV
jgi:hypothetical protein